MRLIRQLGSKACLLTYPSPSTTSRVTVESQLAGGCCHILSTPVGVTVPTSPDEASIAQLVSALLWIVFEPSKFASFQRKSIILGEQWRYILQPASLAAEPVLIRVWLVPLVYAWKILCPKKVQRKLFKLITNYWASWVDFFDLAADWWNFKFQTLSFITHLFSPSTIS